MALTPPTLAGTLIPNLAATGHLGVSMPQFALGVANGVLQWFQVLVVATADTGQLGAGAGVVPLIVPQPVLLAAMSSTFPASGITGIMAPLTILGLSNGLSLGFAQGQVLTTHPMIGVGTGVCTFKGPPAVPSRLAGFASAGLVGTGMVQIATALGVALTTVFSSLVLPTPIAGAGSPASGAGTGTGKIL